MQKKCPICHKPHETINEKIYDSNDGKLTCSRCGECFLDFSILEDFGGKLERDPIVRSKASFSIRKFCDLNSGTSPRVTASQFDIFLQCDLPRPFEMANRLILWLGNKSKEFGEIHKINDANQGAVIGSTSKVSFDPIVQNLYEKGIIVSSVPVDRLSGHDFTVSLSFEGWNKYEELHRIGVDSRIAFMAMPFREPDISNFVDLHIRSAVAATGFTLRRADDEQQAGRIDDQMRFDIRNARFLIADLTHGNRGAFWEAGYAEGLGRPVIYTCREDKFDDENARHFDTNNHLTIKWSANNPGEAMRKLKATIRLTIPEAKQQDG